MALRLVLNPLPQMTEENYLTFLRTTRPTKNLEALASVLPPPIYLFGYLVPIGYLNPTLHQFMAGLGLWVMCHHLVFHLAHLGPSRWVRPLHYLYRGMHLQYPTHPRFVVCPWFLSLPLIIFAAGGFYLAGYFCWWPGWLFGYLAYEAIHWGLHSDLKRLERWQSQHDSTNHSPLDHVFLGLKAVGNKHSRQE